MSWSLIIIYAIFWGIKKIKEIKTPTIPASYWRNTELMNTDKLNPNITPQQIMKNLEQGKYYLSDEEYECRQKVSKYCKKNKIQKITVDKTKERML